MLCIGCCASRDVVYQKMLYIERCCVLDVVYYRRLERCCVLDVVYYLRLQ